MEKVSAAFFLLMIGFMLERWRIHGWSAQSGFLEIGKWKVPRFQTYEDTGSTLAWWPTKLAMGGSRDCCNGTRMVQLMIFPWNKKLTKYVKGGQPEKAMQLFQQMQQGMSLTNSLLFRWSTRVGLGGLKSFHQDAILKCGHLDHHDIGMCEMWTRAGDTGTFQQRQQQSVQLNSVTFVGMLNACASVVVLEETGVFISRSCKMVASLMSSLGLAWLTCIQNVGAHWGCLENVQQDAILRCCHMDHHYVGISEMWARAEVTGTILTNEPRRCATKPVTFVWVLNACASVLALEGGRCAHEQIIQIGWDSDVFVRSTLVDMYAKCGSMEDAGRVFKMSSWSSWNVASWNAILGACSIHGHHKEPLKYFHWICQIVDL